MVDDQDSFTADDIMSRTLVSIDEDSTVNEAVTTLRNSNVKDVVVFSKKRYAGTFGYRQLFRIYGKDFQKTSIKPYLSRPPLIPQDTKLPQIADKMYRLDLKMIPVGKDGSVSGVITESDIVKEALKSGMFKDIRAQDIMSPEPMTIKHDETLAKALKIMRENDIGRLPVMDKDENLKGFVESTDIIERFLTQKENYTGLIEIAPSGKESTVDSHSYAPQEISDKKIDISSFMRTDMVIGYPDDEVSDIFTPKYTETISTVLIEDDGRLIGIISQGDIVRHISALAEKKTMLVWISGIDDLDLYDFDVREMYRMIEETASKLSKKTEINAFSVHVKTYNDSGKRMKYSLRCRLSTAKHIFVAGHDSWDLRDAFGQLMDKMERLVIQLWDKKRHDMQESRRQSIYFEGVD